MAYRDEREALRERALGLEEDLAEARAGAEEARGLREENERKNERIARLEEELAKRDAGERPVRAKPRGAPGRAIAAVAGLLALAGGLGVAVALRAQPHRSITSAEESELASTGVAECDAYFATIDQCVAHRPEMSALKQSREEMRRGIEISLANPNARAATVNACQTAAKALASSCK